MGDNAIFRQVIPDIFVKLSAVVTVLACLHRRRRVTDDQVVFVIGHPEKMSRVIIKQLHPWGAADIFIELGKFAGGAE